MSFKINESQLIQEPDSFYPPPNEQHQEAFRTFFTAESADWSEFFTSEDFNINVPNVGCNKEAHFARLGLSLTIMYRNHFEANHGDWEEA